MKHTKNFVGWTS